MRKIQGNHRDGKIINLSVVTTCGKNELRSFNWEASKMSELWRNGVENNISYALDQEKGHYFFRMSNHESYEDYVNVIMKSKKIREYAFAGLDHKVHKPFEYVRHSFDYDISLLDKR